MSYTNWNAGNGHQQQSGQSQFPPNTHVYQMDWRDILGANATPMTSTTSPFVISNPYNQNAGDGQQKPYSYPSHPYFQSGSYSGTGIRQGQEDEGYPPATFRVSVGNSGDFGGGKNVNFPYIPPVEESPSVEYGGGGGESDGMKQEEIPQPEAEPIKVDVPHFFPCGNCNACQFKTNKATGNNDGVACAKPAQPIKKKIVLPSAKKTKQAPPIGARPSWK